MGFSDYFTSGVGIVKPNTHWCEPWMWEARKNGTFKRKAMTAAVFPVVGAVVMLIIFSVTGNHKNVPALVFAIMGTALGGFASAFYLGKELAPGSVKIGKKEIVRTKYSVQWPIQWMHWERWPYHAIRQCRIIPKKPSSKSYSILEITTHDGQCDQIIISDIVDLTKLGQLIQSHGVSVLVPGGVLPPGPKGNPAIKMVGIRMAIGVPLVLVCIFLATMSSRNGDKEDDQPQAAQAGVHQADRPDIPRMPPMADIKKSTDRPHRSARDYLPDNKRPSRSAQSDEDAWPSQRLRSGDDLPIGGYHPHSTPPRFGPRGRMPGGLRPSPSTTRVPSNKKPPKYETKIPEEEPEGPLVDPFAD